MNQKFKKYFPPLIGILAIFAVWYIVCRAGILSSYVLPSPGRVFQSFCKMLQSGELFRDLRISFLRVGKGFVIAFILAFAFGMLRAMIPASAGYYEYLVQFFKNVPPLSMIPLLILWCGIGETTKTVIIVLASFFPMYLNIVKGFTGCDQKLLEVGTMFGYTERQKFFRIMLPYAMADILVGMRIGLGYSWRAIIGAEMVAASTGLGHMILFAQQMSRTDKVIVGIFAIGIPASVTNFMQSIGVTLTNRFLQPYGTDKVAAMGIALKIIMISVLVMVGFAFGGQPLVGYNYGAKNKKRLSETIRFAFLLEVLTGAGMAVVLGAAAPLLVGLFLKEADVIAVAQQILRVQLIGMPFVGIVLASTCIFQAIGNGAGAMILSAGRQGVIFAIVIFCASKLAGFSGVIASQPVSDFLTALVAVMILLQWKKKEFAK